ncbi:hypothetical protein D7B24_001693 [Verticillium nonalfalfae]|uniref:Uncharacterized protein n=2 Tax=Verticillium TaxID=1036719 RepID=C9S8F7_VERA1|nr:conserved hypothetical protein [Verticillium alfalfae VaMs.102]XP_028491698.1 uncharacterized protein D7B24_001693 [Verticillium nonalfalfae]EEY15347.1 conserved hypothetical protein [Verticillium alfalfae VaMs.102]RNJ53540.1 hypothetical protein D7B24_001693 [Verticillium nonalfalfae]
MSFKLEAGPGTDVWKKHPSWDVYNVPTHALPKKPLTSFRSARLTFSAKWTEQYDQAGILFTLEPRNASDEKQRRWVKTGLEYYNGTPQLSTVACDRYADWSITPLSAVGPTDGPLDFVVERNESEHGTSIWIYYAPPGGKERVALREVGWFFADGADWDLEVAAFAARPAEKTDGKLEVEFSGFEAKWE